MTTDKLVLGPTLTMARLYESQQQFLDALAIYRKLHLQHGDAEVAGKIGELEQKILGERSLHYSGVIEKAFSREELKKFRVLPAEKYAAWRKAIDDSDEQQESSTDDEPAPEQALGSIALDAEQKPQPAVIDGGAEEEYDPKWKSITAEPKQRATAGMTIGQFIERLRALGDDDTPIDRIPLGKLLDALYGDRH